MPKRAPAGASRTFHRVATLARVEGTKAAARLMGVSERRVRMIQRADEKGIYKGIVTTQRGLSRWEERRETAQVKVEARQSARELQAEATRNEIAQAVPGRETEISKALNRAGRNRASAEDLQLIRQAEQRIASQKAAEEPFEPIREPAKAAEMPPEEMTNRERAEEVGFSYFGSESACKEVYPDAIPASRAFANMDDALEKLRAIAKEYFALVEVPRDRKIDIVLYDVRTNAEREKHAKGKPSKGR